MLFKVEKQTITEFAIHFISLKTRGRQARSVQGGGIGEGKMADFGKNSRGGGIGRGKMADGNGDRKCRFLAYYWL